MFAVDVTEDVPPRREMAAVGVPRQFFGRPQVVGVRVLEYWAQ